VVILTFADHYLPGYKAGGAIRTLANVVDRLGSEFDFKIVTSDRDFADLEPYTGVHSTNWTRVEKAEVFYLSPDRRSICALRTLIRSTKHQALYLNSFFSFTFATKPLLLRRLGLISAVPVILAPRGELSAGAMALKATKKRIFLILAKMLRLHRGVIWQASSQYEAADIRRKFGNRVQIVVAQDLPPLGRQPEVLDGRRSKQPGHLKLLFLSRISRKKNLHGALRMLGRLKGNVEFSLYGPVEDRRYWLECRELMGSLPPNIRVQYRGAVLHQDVPKIMGEHQFLFLPSLGENFGHVILEALLAGCPVLLSDQTFWRDLEAKGVGWDLPLDASERFEAVLQRMLMMNNEEYQLWSSRARDFAVSTSRDAAALEQNRALFKRAVRRWDPA
jgi:glycosyltransferase involved in cell wall biosynthesis